jgi:hypothetical protein
MNKFFYKVQQQSHSSVGSATALLQGKRGYSRLRCSVLTKFAVEEFFSYKLFNARKKKIQCQRATYEKSTRFTVEFFLSYESLNSRKAKVFFADELHTRAMKVCESQGSR